MLQIVNYTVPDQPIVSLIRSDLLDAQTLAKIRDCQALVDLTPEILPVFYSLSLATSPCKLFTQHNSRRNWLKLVVASNLVHDDHSISSAVLKSQSSSNLFPLSPLLNKMVPFPPPSPSSLGSSSPNSFISGSPHSDSSGDHHLPSSDRVVYLNVVDIDESLRVINNSLLAYWSKAETAAVVKLIIKKLEPFKQSKFPYKQGDQQRPTWWPESLHREPDHLGKPAVRELFLHLLCVTMFHFARKQDVEPVVGDPARLEKADFSTSSGILDHPRPFTYLAQELTHNACWADRPAQMLDPATRKERNRVLDQIWAILRKYENFCLDESSKSR
jgi:hypothetical protein